MKKNKILITGAAGFLGSHLAEKLATKGDDVIGIDNMMGGYADNVSLMFLESLEGITLLKT